MLARSPARFGNEDPKKNRRQRRNEAERNEGRGKEGRRTCVVLRAKLAKKAFRRKESSINHSKPIKIGIKGRGRKKGRREAPIRASNADCFENVRSSFRGKKEEWNSAEAARARDVFLAELDRSGDRIIAESAALFSLPRSAVRTTLFLSCPGRPQRKMGSGPLCLPPPSITPPQSSSSSSAAATPSQFSPAFKPAGLHVFYFNLNLPKTQPGTSRMTQMPTSAMRPIGLI